MFYIPHHLEVLAMFSELEHADKKAALTSTLNIIAGQDEEQYHEAYYYYYHETRRGPPAVWV